MKHLVTFIFLGSIFIMPSLLFGQRTKMLTTNSKGTFFGYAGYNRTAYTNGSLHLNATGYTLRFDDVSFSDNPNKEGLKDYFSRNGFENFQFNAHIGYYFWHKWAITAGVDHYNIFMDPEQRITINGSIAQGEHGNLVGDFDDFVLNMTPNHFAYSQTDGYSIVRLGVLHSRQFYQGKENKFAAMANFGGGGGLVVSNSDYRFGNFEHNGTSQVSGFAFLANTNIRMVFIQHLFLQMGVSGGIINQRSVNLNQFGNDEAKHFNAFLSPEISLGFSIFIRPTDGCGTCPQW